VNAVRDRLLAIIAGVLVVAALKWSYPVAMPVAAAALIVAAAWPIWKALRRVMPAAASYTCTVLVLLGVGAAFLLALYVSVAELVGALAQRQERFVQLYARYARWADEYGLPLLGAEAGYDGLLAAAQMVLAETYTITAYIGLVAILVLFGLPEVPHFVARISARTDRVEQYAVFGTLADISRRIRSYIRVTIATSLITGLASAGWAAAMGLELALLWGILNFLLNFVPVVGNIAGILPPALYAVLQFDRWQDAAIVFAGYAVLQVTISNLVYPWLQGRGLALSPAAIVLALVFWSWMWGIAGALMAVPLTVACVVTSGRFRATEWVAALLSRR
jgi:AI-2 transport protein TqsA